MEEVVSVSRNQYRKLHTTKSWDFVGLPLTAKRHLKAERDVIIGVLDTGLFLYMQINLMLFIYAYYNLSKPSNNTTIRNNARLREFPRPWFRTSSG